MIKVRNEIGEMPCYLCDFVCSTKQKLSQHTQATHHNPESLVCTYCYSTLKDVCSVRRHIKTVHLNVKEYMCSYCNKKYKHKFDLEKHFKNIHKSQSSTGHNYCSECKAMCFGWEQLKKHYLDAHGKTINHIKCPQCMKIFFEISCLKQHFRKAHTNKDINEVYCQDCNLVFHEHTALVQHMEQKHFWTAQSAVFCAEDKCGELCEDLDDLDQHMEIYHRSKRERTPFDTMVCCTECDGSFCSRLELVAHLTEQHQWRSVMECQKCNKLFSTSAEIQEHLNTQCIEEVESPLLPSGKHSILKKRLLKRLNIKDLSKEIEPRFFVRLDQDKVQYDVLVDSNSTTQEEVPAVSAPDLVVPSDASEVFPRKPQSKRPKRIRLAKAERSASEVDIKKVPNRTTEVEIQSPLDLDVAAIAEFELEASSSCDEYREYPSSSRRSGTKVYKAVKLSHDLDNVDMCPGTQKNIVFRDDDQKTCDQ